MVCSISKDYVAGPHVNATFIHFWKKTFRPDPTYHHTIKPRNGNDKLLRGVSCHALRQNQHFWLDCNGLTPHG